MAQPEACAALGEAPRAVSGAVVGHRRDVDAKLAEAGDDGLEEGGDTGAGFVGTDLGEADAGLVVDADMQVVPAGPGRALAAVPGDAVARLLETREFLDVEVQLRLRAAGRASSVPRWSQEGWDRAAHAKIQYKKPDQR